MKNRSLADLTALPAVIDIMTTAEFLGLSRTKAYALGEVR